MLNALGLAAGLLVVARQLAQFLAVGTWRFDQERFDRLDTLFDGADFEEMTTTEIERTLLSNLMKQATIRAVLHD